MNAVFNAKADVFVRDKRQHGFGRRQFVAALFHQAADTLNSVLPAYVPRRCDVAKIPLRKRCGEDSAAASEFKIIGRTKVDEFPRHLVEESKQRVNLGPEDMRDRARRA
jgi:hypothetical protein